MMFVFIQIDCDSVVCLGAFLPTIEFGLVVLPVVNSKTIPFPAIAIIRYLVWDMKIDALIRYFVWDSV